MGDLHQGKPLLLQTKYRPFCDLEHRLPHPASRPEKVMASTWCKNFFWGPWV